MQVVFFYNTVVIPFFHCVFGDSSSKQIWFFKVTGVILRCCALLWIAPVAIFALVLSVCLPSLREQVEGQLEKELEMV